MKNTQLAILVTVAIAFWMNNDLMKNGDIFSVSTTWLVIWENCVCARHIQRYEYDLFVKFKTCLNRMSHMWILLNEKQKKRKKQLNLKLQNCKTLMWIPKLSKNTSLLMLLSQNDMVI